MDINEIRNIDIISYLAKYGIHPKRSSGKNAMYLSPLGEETEPSFAVNKAKNRFHCRSTGAKGSIIDFVMAKEKLSLKDAINFLNGNDVSDIKPYVPPKKQLDGVKIHEVSELTDGELRDYIIGIRRISEDIVDEYCNMVIFSFPYSKNNSERVYRAVGFQTGKNSYELRNSFMKVCAGAKMIRTIRGTNEEKDKVLLFEAWIDALSYLTRHGLTKPRLRMFVLNGTGMIHILKPMLDNKTVYCYVDADRAGDALMSELDNCNAIDMREEFAFFSDYNDMLMNS